MATLFVLLLILNTLLFVPHVTARSVNTQQLLTIQRYMDSSVDPCEDFYSYACGKWEREHLLEDYYETIGYVDHKTDEQLIRLLKPLMSSRKVAAQPPYLQNAINYYKVCINVEEYDPSEYLRLIEEKESINWPKFEYAAREKAATRSHIKKETNYDWLLMLAVLRKYGLNGVLLEESVLQRKDNNTQSLIDLDKPVLNGGFRPLKRNELTLVLNYMGVRQLRRSQRLLDTIEELETELQLLTEIEDDEGNKEITLADLSMPKLQKYLEILLGRKMPGNTTIMVQNLPYMRKLFSTLEQRDSEHICRYLMLRFIWHLYSSGPSNFLKLDCISHTRSMLPLAISWLQQQHHATLAQDREIVDGIFNNLKQKFITTLESNTNRLDTTIVNKLISKLENMQLRLGNIPNDTAVIAAFYADLRVNASSSFYQNHLLLLQHFTAAQHKNLAITQQLDDNFFHLEDDETGASSSPYYLMRQNTVFVPLGLLQRPIYHKQLMNVFQYSAIGFLLAHEITHGFDESGIEFDASGNMLIAAGMLKENSRFNRSLNCLRREHPEHIDEKIADVNGLRLAYETYFESNAIKLGTTLEMSDVPHLFFLNFAQFFCGSNMRPKVEHSEHGEDSERVRRTLSNFEEFGKVFKCPLGSAMNPIKKCQLWR